MPSTRMRLRPKRLVADRQRLGIFGRAIPGARPLEVGELDHDDRARRLATLQRLDLTAADEVAAAILCDRGRGARPIGLERRGVLHRHVRDEVGGHRLERFPMRWNRVRFHRIGKARTGDRGCNGHIPFGCFQPNGMCF